MHTNWCVLIEISMEIGMLNFWVGLLVTALKEESHFREGNPKYGLCHGGFPGAVTGSHHLMYSSNTVTDQVMYVVRSR